MKLAALDTETHAIQPGLLAPPLVVGSYADDDGHTSLLYPDECLEVFRELCRSDVVIAGANMPYDVGVLLVHAERSGQYPQELLELVFDKWERDGQVHDILNAEALHAIAGGHLFREPNGMPLTVPGTGEQTGRYSLDVVCGLVLGRNTAKVNDFWRMRYAILAHVPRSEWPPDALQYPIDDVVNARDVAQAQRGWPRDYCKHEWIQATVGDAVKSVCRHCVHVDDHYGTIPPCITRRLEGKPHRNIEGLGRECRADLALHLGSLWGLRTNRLWVEAMQAKTERQHAEYIESFRDFYKWAHEPGCLKRMSKAGVTPEQALALGPRLDAEGKKVAATVHCVSGCTYGKENGPLVTRLVAQAYGATGACPSCEGRGRRPGAKGNDVGCAPRNFKHDGSVTCDTTGLDLRTAGGMPRTDGGGVQCDRDALLESGDDRLMAYGDDEFEKVRRTYIPFLTKGTDAPLTLSPNVLLETFRVSYNGPIQQMPRENETRTAFEARRAVYVDVEVPDDYALQPGEEFVDE